MDPYRQPHGYMRPPNAAADPQQQLFHQGQPQPRPIGPPPHDAWFSSQFQYHPSQTPSPPPQQWAPLPPPPHQQDHFSSSGSYPQPSNPYPPYYSYNQDQFPPPPPPLPRPHVPSQYPSHPHIPQSYPQNWGTPNWGQQQSWDYSAQKGEEDWAAKARAWADARAAMEGQHLQSQFTPAGRRQEHAHYHDQYMQSADLHYPETQNPSLNAYNQFPASAAPAHNVAANSKDIAFIGSDLSSYAPDGHVLLNAGDRTVAGEATAVLRHQGDMSTSQTVHLQEVPSSYSSVAGKEEVADQNEQSYTSLSVSNSSAPNGQYPVQAPMDAHYTHTHQLVEPVNPADLPLEFTHRGTNPVSPVPSINNWATPAVPGVAYPSISPVLSSGRQHDPSVIIASSMPGHLASPFGSFTGPGLDPSIPSLNGGTAPASGLSSDVYGISGLSERPKKAPVPNWLRDEIKKAVIAAPSTDHPKEEMQSMDGEAVDKTYGMDYQADSKSIDSSRSTEEEEDDEDYVEAARTAAINQEIKHILTEVLLKVTDELFDEIATKVINEDEMNVDDKGIAASNHKPLAPQGFVPTTNASAKVIFPSKAKETQISESDKSYPSAPGNLLGLANYASDDDEDDEDSNLKSTGLPDPAKKGAFQQSNNKKPSVNMHDITKNGTPDLEDPVMGDTSLLNDGAKLNLLLSENENGPSVGGLHDEINRDSDNVHPLKIFPADRDDGFNSSAEVHNRSNSKDSRNKPKCELPEENSELTRKTADLQGTSARIKSDKVDQTEKSYFMQAKDYECDKGSSRKESKDCLREELVLKLKVDEKGTGNHKRLDEMHVRKEKDASGSGAKEKPKEKDVKHREKTKEFESTKSSSSVDILSDRTVMQRVPGGIAAEGSSRKKERIKDKVDDNLRHKDSRSSERHKRHLSPSLSRGRSSGDCPDNCASDSSDERTISPKRKRHSRKHDRSPSPIRSRRRHVSRSPPSKHSQRRHSPYSSLEASRQRRSRSKSRSPGRRQRK